MPSKDGMYEDFQDVMLPTSCLCLHYCPWLEKCCCSPPLHTVHLGSLQVPTTQAQPPIQKTKVAKAVRSMLTHASAHPVAHRADCATQQGMLTRSSRWGELETLQARVRTASLHLGASDPLVRRTNKVVSRAASLRQHCMNTYLGQCWGPCFMFHALFRFVVGSSTCLFSTLSNLGPGMCSCQYSAYPASWMR